MKRILLMGLSVLFVSAMLISRSGSGIAHAVTYERFCDYNGSGKCLDAAGGGSGYYGQTVQLYTEGQTSGEWHLLNIASVNGPEGWPFTFGNGYNTFFSGDEAVELEYAPNGVASGYCYSPATFDQELRDCTANGENYNTNVLLVEHGSNQQYLVDVSDTDAYGGNANNMDGQAFYTSWVLWANGNSNGDVPKTNTGETGNNWMEWNQP